jgi:tRNA-specific 2-thiouridylase
MGAKQKKKVAVGLSGGVDSSVAALLLKKEGYDVTGVYIQCWDAKADGCAADEDKAYAVQTAGKLGIKFVHLDFKEHYKKKVIQYFYDEYKAGRTPNPDVLCNREIKFGLFFDWAMEEGFDFIATGHYARIRPSQGQTLGKSHLYELLMGKDKSKDQSYFLYLMTQKQLAKTLFPIGDLTKKEVRKIAEEEDLPSAKRPDSMGICFIGEVDTKEFLKKRLKEKNGKVLNTEGEVIGEHDGAWFYTIGQRHGFKVDKYFGKPLYVISKDVEKDELVVGFKEEVYSEEFEVTEIHWASGNPMEKGKLECLVRIRNLGKLIDAKVSGEDSNKLTVKLSERAFGVAPGQSAVFYKGNVVLGGGVITK